MSVNDTLCELAQTDYSIGFSQMPDQCCRPTHIEPFKADVHLFGFECQEDVLAIVVIALITFAIKIAQNFLGARMGQLERELVHMEKKDRKICGKLGELVGFEVIAGVLGVTSILFITGNNAYIWITVVIANAVGVMLSLCCNRPDHHSPAAEMEALLEAARKTEPSPDKTRAWKALSDLKCLLKQVPDGIITVHQVCYDTEEDALLRKRLKL